MRHVLKILAIFFLVIISFSGFGSDSDIDLIRKRVIAELLISVPDPVEIETLIKSIRDDGSWPGINYKDVSRIGFENKIHVTNIRKLSIAYKNQSSSYFGNDKLKQILSSALDYWIAHDFIADNWHTNEISNPLDWNCILLLMDSDLSKQQSTELARMAGRANLDAWGARPGGDRIKIAGIMAELALWRKDEVTLSKAVQTMAEEVKVTSGLGIKADLGFHHRTDRVTAILSYGTGYAGAFADWAVRLESTHFSFPQESFKLIIDYYLDGICKSMVHGWYRAPGIMNRGMAHKGSLGPVNPDIPMKLLAVSDYRRQELENIVKIREGKQFPNLSYNRFFTHSEYLIHQRPGYFASVRMFSDRNHNMEAPHNMESLKHHHFADGANFISRTGKEHDDIFPVWDWQKIPGTTVVQKPSLPGWNEIVKKGKTGFVGAVTDGKYGVAAFDFESPHDPLKARKAWFFFNDEYVCLGSGIQSESEHPVTTTLNQCLLNGDVVVKSGKKQSTLAKGEHQLKEVSWIHHDGIAYLFQSPVAVSLNNKTYSGLWQDIAKSAWTKDEPLVRKDIFSVWIDHGRLPKNASYHYSIIPGIDVKKVEEYQSTSKIKTLSNTSKIQAVQHTGLNLAQLVLYEAGKIELAGGTVLTSAQPGLFMIEFEGKEIKKLTVADPGRKLKSIQFKLTGQFEGIGANWKSVWKSSEGFSDFLVVLPDGAQAGESVILVNKTKGISTVDFQKFETSDHKAEKKSAPKTGEHFIGEKFGGGVVIWMDETGDHGLIAAEKDLSNDISWRNGPSKKIQHFGDHGDRVTNARGDGIYAGEKNTILIIAQLTEDNYSGNFAARLCSECVFGGYGDWYLPSKTELQIMYQLRDEIGGFNNDMYWSSTEYNVGFVWIQNFQGYGGQYSQNKSSSYAVRCVRRF